MPRLKDVLGAKAGKWFSVADVLGVPLLVTEDMTAESEIRMDESNKYYCIQVSDGKETKDLHMAKGALRAIAGIMPQDKTWKGTRFQVTAITGKGYATKTSVCILKGDYVPEEQTRLPVIAAPPPAIVDGVRATEKISDLAVMLGAIDAQPGRHVAGDLALDELALLVCNGDVVKANFLLGVLKSSGRLKNEGGCWSVTK